MPTTIPVATPIEKPEPRNLWQSIGRGFRGRCPHCGEGALFSGYLKVNRECPQCGEALHHHRADDLPAYLSIVVVGHIVIGLLMHLEMSYPGISPWMYLAILLPLTLILTFGILSPIKGAVVGMQWANHMHGFDPTYRD
jgi:uncharacterized protein (DUF983 family)